MRAVVCRKPGELALEERPAPDIPPEGWALIDVSHVGICGTDFHIFEGKHPYLAYPRVMGHEVSGTVAAITAPARASPLGKHVIINPYLSCGNCPACRPGQAELLRRNRGAWRAPRRRHERAGTCAGAKPASSRRPVTGRGGDGRISGRRCSRRSPIHGLRRRSRIGDRRRADWPWHRAVCANRETARDHHGRQCRTAGLCRAATRVPGD